MTTLQDFRRLKEEYDSKLKEDGLSAFREEFSKFFAEHPDIKAIRWHQYTPYFNDGEECVFDVYPPDVFPYPSPQKEKPLDEFEDEGDNIEDPDEDPDDDGWEYFPRIVRSFWGSLDDTTLFQAVFGDHVRVTATREGFTVEEYDHD